MSKTIAPPPVKTHETTSATMPRCASCAGFEPPPPRTEREREGLQRGGLDPDAGLCHFEPALRKVHAVHWCMQYRPRGGS